MKKWLLARISWMFSMLVLMICLSGTVLAAVPSGNDTGWYWLSSDDKYSKFYLTADVKTVQAFGSVAVNIHAWTKTTYAPAGAQETLQNYGITNIQYGSLAYSLAEIEINPQNRTLAYVQEIFYSSDGTVIWSKKYDPLRPKEMNSQEFDEDFYDAVVDYVFDQGETQRRQADDRWLELWRVQDADGNTDYAMADTTTMRMKGDNLIFWEWQETRDGEKAVKEVRFQKKAVNLVMATEKVIRYQQWLPVKGWKDRTADVDGWYKAIEPGNNEYSSLVALKNYAAVHDYWVNRYSLDSVE